MLSKNFVRKLKQLGLYNKSIIMFSGGLADQLIAFSGFFTSFEKKKKETD
jgi:ATP-dependent protease HslVU (ClpYQ) peptidase subunit